MHQESSPSHTHFLKSVKCNAWYYTFWYFIEFWRTLKSQELWVKMKMPSMLLLFNKLRINFQINQPLGMNHKLDVRIGGARNPGQAGKWGEPMGTITSFAFSLEHGLSPPNQQQFGLKEYLHSVGAVLAQDCTHNRTLPLEREIGVPHIQNPSLSFQHHQNLTSFHNSQLHYSFC